MHTGGPKVLEATATALDLPREALEVSWGVLAESWQPVIGVGAAGSGRVHEMVSGPKAGTLSILGAMGPGFCGELLLLRW